MATKTTNNPQSLSGPAKTMAELMQKSSSQTKIVSLQKGQLLNGVITKLTTSEIFVDIKAKTHAMVLEKDRKIFRYIMAHYKVGDTVEVSVLSPESEFGFPVVSMRRFLNSIQWDSLTKQRDEKTKVGATVTAKTTGGYLVTADDGAAGFLPNSQSTFSESDPTGKKIEVYVLEIQKETKKIIFSQKPIMDKEEFEKVTSQFKVGQSVDVTVSSVTSFGIFVAIPYDSTSIDGLIHISELSWKNGEEAMSEFKVGDKITAQIIRFDKETKRIDLSLKRLTEDPFAKILNQYSVDQKITGTVAKILSNGVVIEVEEGIEGFIRKEKIPPTMTYTQGSQISATVSEIDSKKHRLVLVPVLTEKPIGYK